MDYASSRRQLHDAGQREPLLTGESDGSGWDEEGRTFGKTWKVLCAVHFAVVLIVGVALEAVRLTRRGCPLGYEAWFTTQLIDLREIPVQLYSIACITVAVALVVIDLATSRCFRSRKRLERDQDSAELTVGVNIVTTLSLRVAAIFFVTLLGLGTLAYVVLQCGAVFVALDCWTLVCPGRWTCHEWTTIILRIYLVIKCVFVITQIVYFWMLTISNKALFAKSRLNRLMVHHVMATTIYLCVRWAVEAQTYMQDDVNLLQSYYPNSSDLYCKNATGAELFVLICPDTNFSNWQVGYAVYPYGTVQFFPLAIVVGLLFVVLYLDVWNTYRQNKNISTGLTNRIFSTSGFQQLLKLFTDHLRDKALLPSTFVQSVLYSGYVVAAAVTYVFPARFPFSFATGSNPMEELEIVQIYCLVMALLMILLTVAGLVILREHVVVGRALGLFDVLLLISVLGVLCDKIVNVFVFGLGLHSQESHRSVIGIVEQSLWMFQAVLQVVLILFALRREGRYARPCCGTTRLTQVLDTLTVLNFGTLQKFYYIVVFCNDFSVQASPSLTSLDEITCTRISICKTGTST